MESNKPTSLLRALGPWFATAVVVGNVIGSGIFLKPGNIAAEGGQFTLILGVWILGGVLCFLGALCLAELAIMYPHAGGLYVYLRKAYGRPVAFLFGWTECGIRVPGSIAALSVAFVDKLLVALGASLGTLGQVCAVSAVILVLVWVNILGVLWGGRLQLATTIVKVALLLLVALSPLLLLPWAESGTVSLENYSTVVQPRSSSLASQLGAVLLAVMWAYNGWHGLLPLAEEVREPARNLPRALFIGIGMLVFLYVATNLAYHSTLTMDEMAQAGDDAAVEMLRKLMGPVGGTVMATVIMCSVFGAITTNMLQAPRVTFAMGRDGSFFRSLSQIHETYRTPAVAIVVTAILSIAMIVGVAAAKYAVHDVSVDPSSAILMDRVVWSLQEDTIFDLLTNFVVFAASMFYALGILAVIVLRWRAPNQERPYRTHGYPLVPLAFLTVYAWFLYRIYADKPLEARTGLLIIACGLPFYWGYQRWDAQRDHRRQG